MNSPKRCSLSRVTFDDVARQLPASAEFSASSIDLLDVLIVAKGFEERTIKVPTDLASAGRITSGTRVWVATYRTNSSDNAARYEHIAPNLRNASSIEFFDADSPEVSIDMFRELLGQLTGGEKILFDISGASATLIFSVIGALAEFQGEFDLKLTYTTAARYYPDDRFDGLPADERHSAEFLETTPRDSGSEDPIPHPLFRGVSQDSKPIHIIAVPGLGGYERFSRCLAYISEDNTSDIGSTMTVILPHSEDATHRFREEALLSRINQRFPGAEEDAEQPEIKHCDFGEYTHIMGSIVECADERLGSNIALVHLGTKMQSFGAALALLAREEISLIFARPTNFDAQHYSSGIGSTRVLHIPSLHELIDFIRSIGTLRVSRDEASPDSRYDVAS